MRKYRKIYSALLAVLLLLTACTDSPEESGQEPGPSRQSSFQSSSQVSESKVPESYHKEYEVQITEPFYPSAFESYLVPPTLCGNEILITDSNSWASSEKINAVSIQLDTLEEKDLGFFAPEVQADEEYYYWMELYKRDSFGIKRTSKKDGSTQLLYGFERQVVTRLAYGDGYLTWIEIEPIDEQTARWHYYGYNCKTEEVFPICETNYVYSPYAPVLIHNRHITYVEREDDSYRINCVDLEKPSVLKYSRRVTQEPEDIFYDGDQLYYVYMSKGDGTYFIQKSDSNGSILSSKSPLRNVRVYASRYIIYRELSQICVYDMKNREQVFTTKEGASLRSGKNYSLWPPLDLAHGRILFTILNYNEQDSSGDKERQSIGILSFVEKTDE